MRDVGRSKKNLDDLKDHAHHCLARLEEAKAEVNRLYRRNNGRRFVHRNHRIRRDLHVETNRLFRYCKAKVRDTVEYHDSYGNSFRIRLLHWFTNVRTNRTKLYNRRLQECALWVRIATATVFLLANFADAWDGVPGKLEQCQIRAQQLRDDIEQAQNYDREYPTRMERHMERAVNLAVFRKYWGVAYDNIFTLPKSPLSSPSVSVVGTASPQPHHYNRRESIHIVTHTMDPSRLHAASHEIPPRGRPRSQSRYAAQTYMLPSPDYGRQPTVLDSVYAPTQPIIIDTGYSYDDIPASEQRRHRRQRQAGGRDIPHSRTPSRQRVSERRSRSPRPIPQTRLTEGRDSRNGRPPSLEIFAREPPCHSQPERIGEQDRADATHHHYPATPDVLSQPCAADWDMCGYRSDDRDAGWSGPSSSRTRRSSQNHHDEDPGPYHSTSSSSSHPTTARRGRRTDRPIEADRGRHYASSRSSSTVSTSRSSLFSGAPSPSSASSYVSDNHSRPREESRGGRTSRRCSRPESADRPLMPPPPPTVRGSSQAHSRGRGRGRSGGRPVDERNDGYYPPNAWDNNSKTQRRLRKAEREGWSRSRSASGGSSR